MHRFLSPIILACLLAIGCMSMPSTASAAQTVSGASVVMTGVSGAYTFVVCTLSGSTTQLWLVIPSGTLQNSMLATALTAQSNNKTVRLTADQVAQWHSLTGIMVEN